MLPIRINHPTIDGATMNASNLFTTTILIGCTIKVDVCANFSPDIVNGLFAFINGVLEVAF